MCAVVNLLDRAQILQPNILFSRCTLSHSVFTVRMLVVGMGSRFGGFTIEPDTPRKFLGL